MALSRFVVTSLVTVTPDALAAPVAGEPGTGGAAGFGNAATVVPVLGSEGKVRLPGMPLTFRPGDVIYADNTAGFATGAQLLYQAIGAGNLRAYVQGQDEVGHAALSNLLGIEQASVQAFAAHDDLADRRRRAASTYAPDHYFEAMLTAFGAVLDPGHEFAHDGLADENRIVSDTSSTAAASAAIALAVATCAQIAPNACRSFSCSAKVMAFCAEVSAISMYAVASSR